MKASELRISNMLLFDGQPQYVSSIHSDDTIRLSWKIGGECHGCYKTNDKRIEPIPLTEEWLEKTELKRHHYDYYCSSYMIRQVDQNEWIVKFYPSDIGSAKEINGALTLKYVHQLQNLHFAITGEELTLSE